MNNALPFYIVILIHPKLRVMTGRCSVLITKLVKWVHKEIK